MDFALFIALNALLLLRPEELFPDLTGLRLYLVTVTVCTLAALPKLTYSLSVPQLARRPVGVCVLGLFGASYLSFLVCGRGLEGLDHVGEFAKVVLYYFLLVSVVDTPDRLRAFLGWTVVFISGNAAVALLHYNGLLDVPGMEFAEILQTDIDPDTGELTKVSRLVSTGIFNDPNDLCVLVAVGIVLAAGLAAAADQVAVKLLWLLPVGPLFYTAAQTHSRGGVLALLGGVAAGFFARFGPVKSAPLVAVAAAGIVLGGSSRGGNISGGGTAHERLMLWAHGLGDLFRMPFYLPTGLGPGYYVREFGFVAHNSFINAYVELGVLGGGLFFAAFYYAARQVVAAGRPGPAAPGDWVNRLRPVVFAAVVGYAVGCVSLSRNFALPTYLALGVGAAFTDLAAGGDPPARFAVTPAWWRWLAVTAVLGLVIAKFGTQLLGQFGV